MLRGGVLHLNPQAVNRIIERQQPDVGLQPGAEVRTKLQHVFRTQHLLGGAVESFDVGPFQPHHIERQRLPASRIARIAPQPIFQARAQIASLSPAALRKIAESLADNLRPVRPMAPTRYFVGAFVGIFVSIVALRVYRLGAFAIAVMTPLQTTLAIGTGLLVYSLVNQMVPGNRHRIPPALLAVGITILVAMIMAVLFQVQQEESFWGNAWVCIRAGTLVGATAATPFWLVLHRGAILSPRMTGAAIGLLVGLAGTSMLEMHCPNLDAWHILLSHLGVAILCPGRPCYRANGRD